MNLKIRFISLIFGIVIGAKIEYLYLKKANNFDGDGIINTTSKVPKESNEEYLISPAQNKSLKNFDSDFARLEQVLNAMDAMAALTQIDSLPLSTRLSHLQDRKMDEFLNSKPSVQDVINLRSILPMAKYHKILQNFVSRLDFANLESTASNLQKITGDLLDSKEKAAFLKGIGEGLLTTNTSDALRLAGLVENSTLGVDIIKEFIKTKKINHDDVQILLTASWNQSAQTRNDIEQTISQRLMKESPAESLKLAASSSNPNVLENIIAESIDFQNMTDPAVAEALDMSTPGARNALAEKMSKQILETINDKEKLLNLLKLPYPEPIKNSVLSKAGYSLSLVMPGDSFDKFLNKIDDENVREQLKPQNN